MRITAGTAKDVLIPTEELERCLLPKEDRRKQFSAGLGLSRVIVGVNALSVALDMMMGLNANLESVSRSSNSMKRRAYSSKTQDHESILVIRPDISMSGPT